MLGERGGMLSEQSVPPPIRDQMLLPEAMGAPAERTAIMSNRINYRAEAARSRRESQEAFLARKAAVDAILARLTAASADHFGADAEGYLWGEAGSLSEVEKLLQQAADLMGA